MPYRVVWGLTLASCLVAFARPSPTGPLATAFSVTNGGRPFLGDGPLLATITPNGDGLRDRAIVRFSLNEPATVRFELRLTRPDTAVAYATTARRPAGRTTFVWSPPPTIAPRTYVVAVSLRDREGHRRVYEQAHGSDPQTTPVIRVRGVDLGFRRPSARPDSAADLWIASDAAALTLQFFRIVRHGRVRVDELTGDPVSEARLIGWKRRRDRPRRLRVWVGPWPSGMYYLQAVADDGRVGYAPLIVRPRRLGEHRVAVVMPTNTWQAYNFQDADGDGFGDTWYAEWQRRTIRVDRAYQHRGVPRHFRDYDLPFLTWLQRQGKEADFLAESDLESASGASLARAYDAIWFPGHTEYVTPREYDAVEEFRDAGGNLAFLSANNFYWKVVRRGDTMTRTARWRNVGRPEAALIGVQYLANDRGQRHGPFVVRSTESAPWLFEGTGLVDGATFGRYGIEIDRTSTGSPPDTKVLADVADLFGPGRSAQMTYYETWGSAKVFAAGAFTLAGSALARPETVLLANLWRQLSFP